MLTLFAESPRTPEAILLLNDASAELSRRYPEENVCGTFLLEDAEGDGRVFLLARWNGRTVGCGAIRPFVDGIAEIKRLFVQPEFRGKGIGNALLARLEQEAQRLGYEAVVLETGIRQPEAIALYEATGYERIPCWGEYQNNPLSLCYRKALPASGK